MLLRSFASHRWKFRCRSALLLAVVFSTGLITQPVAYSDSSPRSAKLTIGMSTALTGPAADLGINMRNGVRLAFDESNRSGGVAGRQLELIVLDDGYEPSRTAPNMHALIRNHNVDAIIGNVGTPTAITAIPIAEKYQTPFFAAFSGAGALRKQTPDKFVINYRASYAQETAAMVDALLAAGINADQIGFVTQNDSYGDDGFFGGLAAIRAHQPIRQSQIAHGRYTRNTDNVESALATLLLHDPIPKAVILVGAYQPCAKLIRLAKHHGLDTIFLAVSFVGAEALTQDLGDDSDGVVVTQVVPHFDSDLPLPSQFRAACQKLENSGEAGGSLQSYGSLEGYVVANILLAAIGDIRGPIDRTSINDALENLGGFDIGLGTALSLSPTDHQASDTVWPTTLTPRGPRPTDWNTLILQWRAQLANHPGANFAVE